MANRIISTDDIIISRGGIRWNQLTNFEKGNIVTPPANAWDSTGGAGLVSILTTKAAALAGTYGAQIGIPADTLSRYGILNKTSNETKITVQFLFDPNTLTMADGDSFQSMVAVSPGTNLVAFRLGLIKNGPDYKLGAAYFTDAGAAQSFNNVTLVDGKNLIRAEWVASSAPGADDGTFETFLDGVSQQAFSGIDNDTHNITSLQFGVILGLDVGTGGIGEAIDFDNVSWINTII